MTRYYYRFYVFSRNGVISIRNNVISLLFVVLFVNLGIVVGGYHWRFVHPRPYRNYSTQAASSSPTRACFPLACPSSLLLSQPCLHLPHQARQAYHGRQPQHSSYELVPADVIRNIKSNSAVLMGIPQQGPPQSLRGSRCRGRVVLILKYEL